MSHFAVIVIGPDFEKQLAPYHEFECTGTVDEYVQSVDETEERRKEFEEATETVVRLADGTFVSAYDDRFYRDPTADEQKEIGALAGTGSNGKGLSWTSRDWGDGRGYRAKVRALWGAQEVEVKRSERETFLAYLLDYRGKKAVPYG